MNRAEYNWNEDSHARQEYEGIEKYEFKDLFDLESVQHLTDAISAALGVGILIVSPEGTPITKPSHFCDFCENVIRETEAGRLSCIHSDSVIGRCSDKPVISKCLSAGLVDAGISIIIGGKHLASWMVGQVIFDEEEPDEETLRERAACLGIDADIFIQSIQKVPRKSREQFDRIVEMVKVLTMQLSELGLKNFVQKEELACRIMLEDELRTEKAHLEFYSRYDELTGVYTRSYFEGLLDEACRKGKYPLAIISADMNNLKLMNDVFGHQYGDLVLKKLGEILRAEAKPSYIIGRCGGDEFNIAIPFAGEREAEDYCRRIEWSCQTAKECMFPPSVAMGCQTMYSAEQRIRDVIRQADEIMYNAKVQKKQKQNINSDIMDILFRRQYLLKEQVDNAVERVGRFAGYLGLQENERKVLEFAARIQDVGLIAVPEQIVRKPTMRTPEEMAEMEKHSEIGYRLARLYEESIPVAKILLQSHESWDGLGYPDHLKGTEILCEARILYMVTSYSYWISRKPGKSGMDVREARACLKSQAGKQFDPELTERFLQYLEKEEPIE